MTDNTCELHQDLDWYIQRVGHLKDDLALSEQHNREQGREIDRLKTELAIAKMDLARLRKAHGALKGGERGGEAAALEEKAKDYDWLIKY